MPRRVSEGFSLLEVLVSILITTVVTLLVFQLFQRNEAAFRDQTTIFEMQQGARLVLSQIADEIRMAGQGVPVYAAGFDAADSDAISVFLAGSGRNRINFRGDLANAQTGVAGTSSTDFTIGATLSLTVENASSISSAAGTRSSGRFVYTWGQGPNSCWSWIRGELLSISLSTRTLTLVPRQMGDGCRQPGLDGLPDSPDDFVRLEAFPTVTLDQAVSFYLQSESVWRATGMDFSSPGGPDWTASEIGRNFVSLTFTYLDRDGNRVTPDTLQGRQSIAGVEIEVTAQTAQKLSNGSRASYRLTTKSIPRNMRIRAHLR